jgi:hypothetical protein
MKGQLFIVLFAALIATGCGKKPTEVAPPDAGAPPKAAKLRVVAPGDAPADLKQSYVQLSIIKDKDVKNPVVGRMLLDDGAVALSSPTPSAHLLVDIDTLDTGVPIRNERVRNIFFETSNVGWDTVDVTIPVLPAAVVTALQGQRHVEQAKLDATLKVHGRKVMTVLTVDASYSDDGRLTVKTSTPAQVKISDFGLGDNLRRLSSICMHDSIDDVVNVEVLLQFIPPK